MIGVASLHYIGGGTLYLQPEMVQLSFLPRYLVNMQLFALRCVGVRVVGTILCELAVEGCQTLSHVFLVFLVFNLHILCNSLEEHRK